ncbi:MAG: hypothetical protein PWP51_2830 [Clostridiales bacterium]|jgi:hypothetical protein|nr:hypothetical protein [Clostridiales bacterium]MDN5300277.1 hypothetical protein [Clostridiales bacterium]
MNNTINNNFVGYDYKTITTDSENVSMYLDGFTNFGWIVDDNIQTNNINGKVTMKFKRDRKILNKTELTRLQRHFEACMLELSALERSKASDATAWSLVVGFVGTAFIAGSVFAVTNDPPQIPMTIIFGIPGCLGWILPYFVYKSRIVKKTAMVNPHIEQKYDEIYSICEKGNKLLKN